jgi:predicted ATP-grasp superfamily ATP-dependent carboligase
VSDRKIGAVVIGGYVNALDAVRALAAWNVPVAVVRTQPYDIAHLSWRTSESVSLEDSRTHPDPLFPLLRQHAQKWPGRVLIATTDPALETLSRRRDELSRHYRVPIPRWEVTSRLLRKDRTANVARETGVPTPFSYGPACRELLDRGCLRFPVVLKPANSHLMEQRLGRKLLAVRDEEEFRRNLDLLAGNELTADVFDLVPGPDGAFFNYLTYIDRQGRPVAELAVRKIRKAPAFHGVGRVVTNADVPHEVALTLRRHTLAILDAIGWRGPASAEFKLDPRDGQLRLMDINGRCSLMMGIARRAGLDFPHLIWKDAVGGELSPVRSNGWKGVWINAHADILHGAFFHSKEGYGWREYLAPYRRPRTYAVWSLRDPMPALAQWARSLASAMMLPFSRSRRSLFRRRIPQVAGRQSDSARRPEFE